MASLLCVVAITRNASTELSQTLESFISRVPGCSLVISDDSDIEEEIERTKQISSMYGGHYLAGPRKGPVANRFAGLKCAVQYYEPDTILFLDDDISFPDDAAVLLAKLASEAPKAVICPAVAEGERRIFPTEVNWKGVRCKLAPPRGGSGLTDACMIWPTEAALAVEWNTKYRYGYAEAWLGVQVQDLGYTICVLKDISVVHRKPGRGVADPDVSKLMEDARVYYNFLIKRHRHGVTKALGIVMADAILTNAKRLVRGRKILFTPYVSLLGSILLRSS